MTFFNPEQLKQRRIEIDTTHVSANSPEVQRRLDRIQENYQQLDQILSEMESKIASDERLIAIDGGDVDFEATFGIKKKRKWRPAKPKAKSKRRTTKSADPRKPR